MCHKEHESVDVMCKKTFEFANNRRVSDVQ